LRQPFADFPGSHANDAVVGQVRGRVPAKNLDRKRPFLQAVGVTLQGAVDDELKKTSAAMAPAKRGTFDNPMELKANPFGFGTRPRLVRFDC
jgi:hypothetical protein